MTTLLLRGSRGVAVRNLQEQLNRAVAKAGHESGPIAINGEFDAATERAVCAFQQRLGLVIDGKAGPQTLTALKRDLEAVKPGRTEPNKSAMAIGAALPIATTIDHTAVAAVPPNNVVLLDTARPISEIIFHCTATPEGKDYTVADIRAWHKERGWSDIGYHYVVYRDGSIMVGRPVGQVGAHVENHNTGTIGVSYIGGLTPDAKTAKDTRTPKQIASLLWLRNALMAKHAGIRKVTGHNQYAAKACPSFSVPADPLGRIAA